MKGFISVSVHRISSAHRLDQFPHWVTTGRNSEGIAVERRV